MLLIQVETEYIHASDHDTTAFTFFIKIGISKISQIPRHLGNFPDTQAFGKFPKWLDIWGIYQKPRHLGNSPNVWVFGRFIKCLGIWGISSHMRNFQNLKNIPPSVGVWEISQITFGKFPRYPGIWEIPEIFQILLGIWGWYIFWKFIKWLDIWGISQKPGHP